MPTHPTDNHRPRPRVRRAAVAVAAAAVLAPATAFAAAGFSDVPASNIFVDDIAWLADAGVTKGCNPPENDHFCPKDTVTRETMAAFMHRLADNRVVDAGRVGGRTSGQLRTPVVMASGDMATGTELTGDGAVRGLDWTAPANGSFVVRHDASWVDAGADYVVGVWVEPAGAGACDNGFDGDPLDGTLSGYDSGGSTWGSTGGHGSFAVSAGETGQVVLCVVPSGPGTPQNMGYAFSVEFHSEVDTPPGL